MKIAIDGLIYQMQSVGGISRIYNEILPRMCDLETELSIILYISEPTRQSPPIHMQIQNIPLLRNDLRPARVWHRLGPTINQALLSIKVTRQMIWHSTYFTLPARPTRAVVTTVYDTNYIRFASMFTLPNEERLRQRQKRSIQAADVVICISETTARDVQQLYGIGLTRIRVVPLACSGVFRPRGVDESDDTLWKPPTDKPFLLYVGQRRKYKNFGTLLRAYSTWSEHQQVDLVVAGQPWSATEQEQIRDLKLEQHIHLLTGVDDHRLRELYLQTAAFVYPSLWEGFGIPILEAMACHCPVVASRIPTTVEVGGEYPIYFEAGDSDNLDSLHCALSRALREGRTEQRIALADEYAKRYSWDQTARQTLAVYRAL